MVSTESRDLHGEALAALGATTCEYVTSALGCHASTETVGLGALPLVWLIRAFHGSSWYLWSGEHSPLQSRIEIEILELLRLRVNLRF